MIADILRNEIESFTVQIKSSNPMYLRTAEGTLEPEAVGIYLSNILHLLRHTPPYLRRARDRAEERGDEELAAHFAQKLDEEAGHDEWAMRDIDGLSRLGVDCGPDIVPALTEMLDYLRGVIDEDPTLYLAYILFAEYFTVLEGPQWLALLEERCGIPQRFMSAVANHAELDKGHVEEGLDVIDELVTDPSYATPMRRTIRRSMECFDRFLSQVAAAPVQPKASRARPGFAAAPLSV